jgi:hypothetical protein
MMFIATKFRNPDQRDFNMSDDPWAIWHRGGEFYSYVEGTVVPKAFLPALGYVVAAFSRLDAQLDLTIAHLLGADRTLGRAIASAAPNYRPRIELFSRIIDLKVVDDGDRKLLHRIAKAIESVADNRHRILHDYASSLSEINQILSLERKESIFRNGRRTTDVTKASHKELGTKMTDLTYRLQRFTKGDPRWKSGEQFPWRGRPRSSPRPPD